MARGRKSRNSGDGIEFIDYRHDDTRKNIPPAKIAAEGRVPDVRRSPTAIVLALIRPCASTGRRRRRSARASGNRTATRSDG